LFYICSLFRRPDPPLSTPPATPDDDDWSRPLAEGQLALLGRLAEAGLEVALAVERTAKRAGVDDEAEPVDLAALSLAYARASRAVRLTVMLQSKVIADLKARDAARHIAMTAAADEQARREPLYARKVRIERVVERLAEAEHGDDEDKVDRLVIEAGERLDDEDFCGDILERPIGEIVALICRDLGLEPDWPRLAEQAWAREEAAKGDPRSPFVGLSSVASSPVSGSERGRWPGGPEGAFLSDTG
jgi:hypothetical protein